MKKGDSILQKVTEQLNRHEYTDLTKFLDGIDWFSIPHEQIVPRKKVRAFIKSIENEETRFNVAKFLQKYEDYYFKEVDNGFTANFGPDPIAEFHRELEFLMKQLTANGEFSDDKFSKLQKRIAELEKQERELKADKQNLQKEIVALTSKIDELEHPERRHQIPNELQSDEFYYIINYLYKSGVVTPIQATNAYYRNQLCYHWNKSKALFGYFVCKICYLLELRTKNDHLIWKFFKQAFDNFDDLEKQARDIASKNRNWETSSSTKPDEAYLVDDALRYSEAQIEKTKAKNKDKI